MLQLAAAKQNPGLQMPSRLSAGHGDHHDLASDRTRACLVKLPSMEGGQGCAIFIYPHKVSPQQHMDSRARKKLTS